MYFTGLSGPASTGKTTLLAALREPVTEFADRKGLRVVFQEERARTVFQSEFSHRFASFDAMIRTEPLVFQKRLSEIFVQDACAPRDPDTLIIADRTGLDVLVYTLLSHILGARDLECEEVIYNNLRRAILRVDKTFMTKPLPFVEDDGFRPESYQGNIRPLEENLFKVMGGTYPNTVWLPYHVDERVDLVMATVRGFYE